MFFNTVCLLWCVRARVRLYVCACRLQHLGGDVAYIKKPFFLLRHTLPVSGNITIWHVSCRDRLCANALHFLLLTTSLPSTADPCWSLISAKEKKKKDTLHLPTYQTETWPRTKWNLAPQLTVAWWDGSYVMTTWNLSAGLNNEAITFNGRMPSFHVMVLIIITEHSGTTGIYTVFTVRAFISTATAQVIFIHQH